MKRTVEATVSVNADVDEKTKRAHEFRQFVQNISDADTIALQRVKQPVVRAAILRLMAAGKTLAEACTYLGVPHP